MFAPKHKIIAGLIVLTLCTCVAPDKRSSRNGRALVEADAASSHPADNGPKNFLDSIQAKKSFTFREVNEHANIDSIYYKSHISFIGDTVWYRHGKHPLAIIRFGNGSINKKLLLVFNRRGDCTASLVVGMNGDVDPYDSVVLNYKIIDDRSFFTTEIWTYRGAGKDDKITVTKQFYQVNKQGRIMAQENIIRSFTKPKVVAAAHRQ